MTPKFRSVPWWLYLTIGLLVIFTLVFGVEFILASQRKEANNQVELSASSYMDEVNRLLENANPENGTELIVRYQCVVCHVEGADRIAPSFIGIATRAETRRPPLSAPAYLYESIINPTAYLVEDYQNAMPINYQTRLSDGELGDILAYLLDMK